MKAPHDPSAGVFCNPAAEYVIDAGQRMVLFLDTMRQRGNQYNEHLAEKAPHVLDFKFEPIADGRTLERPVNYALVRVLPPDGVETDESRRPFVVIDPRAGHGPGIGGFKADSEIGVALKAGHPCYFIGFLPEPMPGQTIEDVGRAEAKFLEKVIALHPQADGRPCVIGNCQAGWAIMMLAACRPELFGPLIVAGSPLSYWAGTRGENPMRYTGGLLGGSWLTAFASDLGQGKFDGAALVQNFESLNPSNTLWTKQYNLYANIDSEADRYLGFERWWGGHVNLNAEEIQFIVDELFVGNHLAAGRIQTSDGAAIDLRNIRSPIVILCSKGDNITPPSQALGWLLDLYDDVHDLQKHGQTVVYTIHETVGHLGIFVSGGVARKEHDELASNIELIDLLPPGLYEAVFERCTPDTTGKAYVSGDWVMRCEARTLDDIRALGDNDAADERRFATAARVSETNLALYRAWLQPWLRAMMSNPFAEAMHRLHPSRSQYEMFSDSNPFMIPLKGAAEWVREHREPADQGNPLALVQEAMSRQIVAGLDVYRDLRDRFGEQLFLAVYGSPMLQAACGIDPKGTKPLRKAQKSLMHRELIEKRIAELRAKFEIGGLREALIRSMLYIGMERGGPDERGFAAIRRLRSTRFEEEVLPLPQFKMVVREQFFMLLIDQDGALAAIPKLLRECPGDHGEALLTLTEVLTARGQLTPSEQERLRTVTRLFGTKMGPTPSDKVAQLGQPKAVRAG
jgi:pimeloyl-ACP methyl ester carboxylesterase